MRKVLLLSVLSLVMVSRLAIAEELPAMEMTAEQKAQMEAWEKSATPGANHKVLDPLVGEWKYTSRMWKDAQSTPEESQGTTTSELIYDGRFLKEKVKGEHMGKAFEGVSIIGYNNVNEEYESVWFDNMMTGMMFSKGTYDEAAKKLTFNGQFSCPMTGQKNMDFRSELVIQDQDNHTYSMYSTGPDGQEFKGMEIQYTRA